jgi:hypothetical protein
MYRFWVWLHVVGAFAFFMGHGASAAVALRIRRERDVERIRALMELSSASIGAIYIALLILLAGGITAGFLGHWWGEGWIWTAIGVLVLTAGAMYGVANPWMDSVRHAVGIDRMDREKLKPKQREKLEARYGPLRVGTPDEIAAAVSSSRPFLVLAIGGGALLVLLWLMIYKPF